MSTISGYAELGSLKTYSMRVRKEMRNSWGKVQNVPKVSLPGAKKKNTSKEIYLKPLDYNSSSEWLPFCSINFWQCSATELTMASNNSLSLSTSNSYSVIFLRCSKCFGFCGENVISHYAQTEKSRGWNARQRKGSIQKHVVTALNWFHIGLHFVKSGNTVLFPVRRLLEYCVDHYTTYFRFYYKRIDKFFFWKMSSS
jgi:hypothetical protein